MSFGRGRGALLTLLLAAGGWAQQQPPEAPAAHAVDKTFLLTHAAVWGAAFADAHTTSNYMHRCDRLFPTDLSECGETGTPWLGRRPTDVKLYVNAVALAGAVTVGDYLLARALRRDKQRRAWLIVPAVFIVTRCIAAGMNQSHADTLASWER